MKNTVVIIILILSMTLPNLSMAGALSSQTERIAIVSVLENESKTPGWNTLQNVYRLTTVKVYRKHADKVVGQIQRWNEQEIVVIVTDGTEVSIEKAEVAQVTTEIRTSAAGAKKGAMIGALTGVAVFALMYASIGGCDAGYQCNDLAPAMTLIGISGATGAFIGAGVGGNTDRVLYQAGDYRQPH